MRNLYVLCTLSLVLAFNLKSFSQTPAQRQIAKPKGTTSLGFGYYEYLPSNYSSTANHPVVIFFHGVGEKGNGTSELIRVVKNGPPQMVLQGKDFPFILLSVQHPTAWWNGTEVNTLINYVKSNYKIDPSRIYVTGLSAGGFGTWTAGQSVTSQLAAIVPVCGCGQTQYAVDLINLPIWAFHNSGDGTVKSSCTVNMANEIKKAGGNPITTIYLSNSHDAWTAAYNEQKMWDWLLSQRKGIIKATNQNPYVSAGSDKTITLPNNSVTLSANASDKDGSIVSYKWNKISGPYLGITPTPTPTITLTSMVEGTYVYMVTVQDNLGATAYDQVRIIVNPAQNEAPIVSVTNKTITLPTNTTQLSATVSDNDGTIVSTIWTQISGVTATLANANTTTLTASNLVAGTYVFRLTATDDKNASTFGDVTLKVNPSTNIPPTVSAGADKVVTLPITTVTVVGTSSDSDGTIASRTWTKVTGPTATMTDVNTSFLKLSNLVAGTYEFKFTVKDDKGAISSDNMILTVNPQKASLGTPVVSAGDDKLIHLPNSTITLVGSSSSPNGSIVSRLWTQLSGPATATMVDHTTSFLKLSSLVAGTYVFRFTVKDNINETSSDEVNLVVNARPIVNAGADKTITLPTNTTTLTATSSDSDGTIASTTWTKVSGPTVTMTNSTQSTLSLTNLVEGIYVFRATVKDNRGLTVFDDVKLTVSAPVAPLVNAGEDRRIHAPNSTITLVGTSSAINGTIVSRNWTKISGPTATLTDAHTSYLKLSNLVPGVYVFRFTVKDDLGISAFDDATLTVNIRPIVDAGADKTISLPNSLVTIVATSSDADGTIVSTKWKKTQGPAVTMTDINTSSLKLTNLVAGTYKFEVTVTDNLGAFVSDEIQVTVLNQISSRIAPQESSLAQYQIYPNPARENIRITTDSNSKDIMGITILNGLDGKTVVNQKGIINSDSHTEINITDLKPGVYLVKLKTASGEKTIRFIKE